MLLISHEIFCWTKSSFFQSVHCIKRVPPSWERYCRLWIHCDCYESKIERSYVPLVQFPFAGLQHACANIFRDWFTELVLWVLHVSVTSSILGTWQWFLVNFSVHYLRHLMQLMCSNFPNVPLCSGPEGHSANGQVESPLVSTWKESFVSQKATMILAVCESLSSCHWTMISMSQTEPNLHAYETDTKSVEKICASQMDRTSSVFSVLCFFPIERESVKYRSGKIWREREKERRQFGEILGSVWWGQGAMESRPGRPERTGFYRRHGGL